MSGYERTGEAIGADVSVIVVDAAPGEGPRLHRHRYREVFVVLEGEATFTLGEEQRIAHAGEIVGRSRRRAAPVRQHGSWTPASG
jgi:quercetin dioxygenase-like cupin family protein